MSEDCVTGSRVMVRGGQNPVKQIHKANVCVCVCVRQSRNDLKRRCISKKVGRTSIKSYNGRYALVDQGLRWVRK